MFFDYLLIINNLLYIYKYINNFIKINKTPNHGKLSTNLSGPLKFGLRYPQVETLFEEMKIIDCNLQNKKKLSKGNNNHNNNG